MHSELKKFYFSTPPTANQIIDIVQEHRLGDCAVGIERIVNQTMVGMTQSMYRYEVIFERTIS